MPTQLFSLGQILEPLTSPLESWLGPEALENWLATLKPLPYCGRLFLEFHPALSSPRCDVIIGVLASDGSLSGWIEQGPQDSRPIWNKTRALLKKWHRQLGSQQGALAAYCFMVWLEFDICATRIDAGDPSIFIALTPQADVARIADELGDYPELRDAITGFKATIARHSNIQEIVQADPLVLGISDTWHRVSGTTLVWHCEVVGVAKTSARCTDCYAPPIFQSIIRYYQNKLCGWNVLHRTRIPSCCTWTAIRDGFQNFQLKLMSSIRTQARPKLWKRQFFKQS